MKETAENTFETAWKEYINYKNFVEEQAETIKKERKNFEKYAFDNQDDVDGLTKKLFEINEKPALYKSDLLRHQTKILHLYEAYQGILEFPPEVPQEIKEFPVAKMLYRINKEGKSEEIDPDYVKEIKKTTKQNYEHFVKNMLASQQDG